MRFSEDFIVKPGTKADLSGRDPGFSGGYKGGREVASALARSLDRLRDLQYTMYAENKRSLLIVLQAMDAGGKDGVIRNVMGPLNPQSCKVTSFKAPCGEELAHDFLWRIHKAVPGAGEIGVFNRSHYEDVLIVRVRGMFPRSVWGKRYRQINAFEKILADNNVHILKFFLHISKDEQLARLKKRLQDPKRQWKASPADFTERRLWDDYIAAYEDALTRCSTACGPWFVIPADKKWFRNLAVARIIVEALERLDMKFPKPAADVSQIVVM